MSKLTSQQKTFLLTRISVASQNAARKLESIRMAEQSTGPAEATRELARRFESTEVFRDVPTVRMVAKRANVLSQIRNLPLNELFSLVWHGVRRGKANEIRSKIHSVIYPNIHLENAARKIASRTRKINLAKEKVTETCLKAQDSVLFADIPKPSVFIRTFLQDVNKIVEKAQK